MPTVAAVRLRYSSQEYWFDPKDSGVRSGDHVVVDTARGQELGLCTVADLEVSKGDISKPLKAIVRVATEEDLEKADKLAEKNGEAMREFRELVDKHKLDMKPVDVTFMFDEAHATFYFTAEERVDFRALVRDLASMFHVRVDMRQIGPRDEARMIGGLGHCGEELCCARTHGEFMPISIRMAKEQDLPLNPSKISGLCGRLMCCLRYEFEAYKDFKSRAPKKGALIDTPLGMAKVVEFDTPRETVRVRFEDGKSVTLPVSALDTGDKVAKNGENIRPCHISQEKFDEIIEELHHDQTLAMMGEKLFSSDPSLSDKTATAGAISRNPRRRTKVGGSGGSASGDAGKPRRRRRGGKGQAEPAARDNRKRRRSVSVSGDKPEDKRTGGGQASAQGDGQQKKQGNQPRRRRRRSGGGQQNRPANGDQQRKQQGKPRPGQHSSTVSGSAVQHDGDGQVKPQGNRKRRRRGGRGRGGNRSGQPTDSKPKDGE